MLDGKRILALLPKGSTAHARDAWSDHSTSNIGYEIPLYRHFYVYQLPRTWVEIEAEMKVLESEIKELLEERSRRMTLVRKAQVR